MILTEIGSKKGELKSPFAQCLKRTEIIPSKKVRRTEVIPILMKID